MLVENTLRSLRLQEIRIDDVETFRLTINALHVRAEARDVGVV